MSEGVKSPGKADQARFTREFEQLAIERLRQHGFRITMPRIQVIRALADANEAMTAQGIHAKITQETGRLDVVSVYRILAALLEAGLVHHIGVVDGYLACRMGAKHGTAAEHAVCSSCKQITELAVPGRAIKAIEEQLSGLGMDATAIKVEITGLCEACSRRAHA